MVRTLELFLFVKSYLILSLEVLSLQELYGKMKPTQSSDFRCLCDT